MLNQVSSLRPEHLQEYFLRGLPAITNDLLRPKNIRIGEGGEGKIELFEHFDNDMQWKKVVLKTVNGQELNQLNVICLRKEAEILVNNVHRNIIGYLGSYCNENKFSLVLEYCRFGSCDQFLQYLPEASTDATTPSWVWPLKRQIASEVAGAMHFLHEKEVLHLDLKSQNILISNELHPKVSDFGCSKVGLHADVGIAGLTYTHAAPERIMDRNRNPTTKWDVFSFAIFLWELATSEIPYQTSMNGQMEQPEEFYKHFVVEQGSRPEISLVKEENFRKVILTSWAHSPEIRPGFEEIKERFNFEMNDQQYNEAKEYCLSYGEDQSSNFAEGDSPMSTIADTASLARSIIIIDRPATNNRLILERNPIRRIDEVSTVENDDFSNDSENLLSSSNSESQGEDAWTRLFENSCAKHRRKIILIVLVVMLGVAAAVMFGLILRTHGSTYNHTCKKLKSPPNGGSIACKKNACKFTCPVGSRLMINASCPGKNTTVCETVGTSVPFWTNPVPYCEKVICCPTLRPSVGVSSNSSCSFDGETTVLHSGEVYSMFQNGTKCTVLCQPTYVIKGFPEVTCATTSLWQPYFPSCQEKECPDIRPSDFLSYTCTNKNKIGSVCKFLCSQGRHILGPTSITCETSMNWSSLPPKCQSSCPPCMTGPDCKHIKSWNKLKDDIVDKPWAKFIAFYAGFSITCEINKHGGVFNFNWDCTCTDLSSSYQHRCNDYKSPGGSCKHALAFLVKDMVRKGVYPEPCDTSEMPNDCN